MSELSVRQYLHNDGSGLTWGYDKSEADKVIARLKYKRCLAMARMCERKRVDAANYRIPREKWEFYEKWHKRWLKIAEKFEPNNSTAQQGKG